MSILVSKWRKRWRGFKFEAASEEDAELREIYVHAGLRVAAAFAVLFGLVFFAFWWSGSAVRFGASRASEQAVPTWKVKGTVRSAVTHEAIPWATVEDDPGGRPPFHRTDANYAGVYELLTLAEPHLIRISAPGYQNKVAHVGRAWYLWLPRGEETRDIELSPQ